jgi:hypothetical protein
MAWRDVYNAVPDGKGGTYEYVQNCDPELAQGWIDEAARLTSDEAARALENKDLSASERRNIQADVTQRAWIAAGNVYRSLNLPPPGDEAFDKIVAKYDAAFRDRLLPIARDRGLVNGGAPDWSMCFRRPFMLDPGGKVVFGDQDPRPPADTGDLSSDQGAAPPGFRPAWPSTYPGRTTWAPDGEARPALASADDWDTIRYVDRNHATDWLPGGDRLRGWCSSYWQVPVRWSYEEVRELVKTMVDRGALGMVRSIRLNILAKNLREADAAGLLNNQNDPTGALREAAAKAKVNAESATLVSQTSQGQTALAAMGVVAGACAAIPVYGPLISAVIVAAAAIVSVLPIPKFIHVDRWGRPRPVFETPYITIDSAGHPTHSVPEPDGGRKPVFGEQRKVSGPNVVTAPAPTDPGLGPKPPTLRQRFERAPTWQKAAVVTAAAGGAAALSAALTRALRGR